jgi:hypothetical protein
MWNSVLPLLLVLFVGLKLAAIITWPWLGVLAPLWAPLALVFAIVVVFGGPWLIYKVCRA